MTNPVFSNKDKNLGIWFSGRPEVEQRHPVRPRSLLRKTLNTCIKKFFIISKSCQAVPTDTETGLHFLKSKGHFVEREERVPARYSVGGYEYSGPARKKQDPQNIGSTEEIKSCVRTEYGNRLSTVTWTWRERTVNSMVNRCCESRREGGGFVIEIVVFWVNRRQDP
ncbi:hypothetical protein K435DRAFT_807720 [Dendrothele bispora CBS 962.96]|uniref:Uncharacterized protein n=1 Tax=Dendrothele bispora (strain CBS 962.96) TaxID=1314807 RepID=A0A4V4HCF6_DENBC|nr:hypothetical protein K435DRAFT_807720 [Dendrothele bispora CBS 962.96]